MAVLGSVFAIPALAADLPAYAPEPVPVSSAYDWSGFYAGVHVGYGWGDTELSGSPTDLEVDGFFGGGQIGYNIQSGNFVFGLEADIAASGADGDLDVVPGSAVLSTDVNWQATVRGRVGYAFDNVLPYVTGGFAALDAESDLDVAGTTYEFSETYTGWTVGAGVELGFGDNLSAKIEYLYADFGEESFTSPFGTVDTDVSSHTVKAGLNYRF